MRTTPAKRTPMAKLFSLLPDKYLLFEGMYEGIQDIYRGLERRCSGHHKLLVQVDKLDSKFKPMNGEKLGIDLLRCMSAGHVIYVVMSLSSC